MRTFYEYRKQCDGGGVVLTYYALHPDLVRPKCACEHDDSCPWQRAALDADDAEPCICPAWADNVHERCCPLAPKRSASGCAGEAAARCPLTRSFVCSDLCVHRADCSHSIEFDLCPSCDGVEREGEKGEVHNRYGAGKQHCPVAAIARLCRRRLWLRSHVAVQARSPSSRVTTGATQSASA